MTKPRPVRTASEHLIEVPRTARYYSIAEGESSVEEIWIVIHGFGQLAADFIEYFVDLKDARRLIVAPEALNRYYTVPSTTVPASERPVGATWMTREDRDNEIRDYVRYLDRLAADLLARHPAAFITLLGFSQGGATASRWVMLGGSRISRLILWGATLPPDTDLALAKERIGQTPFTIVVGTRDQYIGPDALAAERARLTAAGIPFELVEYDGAHSIKRSVLTGLAAEIPPAR